VWKAALKGLIAHKLRVGLTALAIVLGVSFIASTYVLTDTLNRAFDELFGDITSGVDVYVRAGGDFRADVDEKETIPESLLERVRRVDAVARADGGVEGFAQMVDKDGEAITPLGPPTIGLSWSDNPNGILSIREGRPPQGPDEVVIDSGTAETYGFRPGDTIKIVLLGPAREFTISGTAGFGEGGDFGGATLAAFDLPTAQKVLGKKGRLDAIQVVADEGTPARVLRDQITPLLPQGIEAVTGTSVAEEQTEEIREGLGFLNTALLVFAGVALFVGTFMIFNTFSIVVAQRTHEFALLRTLGASRRQVLSVVLAEAAVVGSTASIIGLGLGIAVAVLIQKLLNAFGVDLPTTTTQVLPRTGVVSIVVGTLVTVVASLLPARRAARVAPLQAVREAAPSAINRPRARITAGGTLGVTGIAALLIGLSRGGEHAPIIVGGGAFLLLLGVAVSSPVFTARLALLIGEPIQRVLGVSGKLAQQNGARSPTRTAATASALMIGVTLVSFTLIFGASVKTSAGKLIADSFRADFLITSSSFGSTTLSPKIADRIAKLSEVTAVGRIRFGTWQLNGAPEELTAVDPRVFGEVVAIGEGEGALRALARDEVLVQRDAAAEAGIRVGDKLPMEFPLTGVQDVRVAGLYGKTKDALTGDFIVSHETYDEHFSGKLDDMVAVKAAPGVDLARVRNALEAATRPFPNAQVQDQTEFRENQVAQLNRLLGLVTALLLVAVFIAFAGITSTLALSVFERTREIGLLRAVGMSRRQTRSMVRWEAVIIAFIGALVGVVVGVFYGWAFVRALADEGITELVIPAGQLFVLLVTAGLAGIVAAVPPARRAARLNVLEAIATE
jgi:putative ABC transport system permease protein